MKRLLGLILAVLAFPALVSAQEVRKATFNSAYDLAGTSYTFCLTTGVGGNAFAEDMQGPAPVTAAASTTVAATTVGTNPFAFVSVGDVLVFRSDSGTVSLRYVTARASADSVTVDASTTVTASNFAWRKVSCGTAATDGWVDVSPYADKNVGFEINTINATSIDVKVECQTLALGSNPVIVYPPASGTGTCGTGNFTSATGARCAVAIYEPWDRCRVGAKVNTDTGVQSLTSYFMGRLRR